MSTQTIIPEEAIVDTGDFQMASLIDFMSGIFYKLLPKGLDGKSSPCFEYMQEDKTEYKVISFNTAVRVYNSMWEGVGYSATLNSTALPKLSVHLRDWKIAQASKLVEVVKIHWCKRQKRFIYQNKVTLTEPLYYGLLELMFMEQMRDAEEHEAELFQEALQQVLDRKS